MGLRRVVLAVLALLACLLPIAPAAPALADGTVPAPLTVTREPHLRGTLRFGSTVRVSEPRFAGEPDGLSYQWLRDGVPLAGETTRRHVVLPGDVGHRLSVQVTARSDGSADMVLEARRRAEVRHRRDVGRRVTYHVETRGPVRASVREFSRLAQATYDDPRGWRGAGIAFRRVARGGDLTLVLATAEQVPQFSSGCSSTYSCRVGRYVIINQTRWLQATPSWVAAGGSLRDYRHLVVDHETGHWLGLGHAGCPRPGAPAPVMMQQSKGLDGCHFNPFPTLGELASRAPRAVR